MTAPFVDGRPWGMGSGGGSGPASLTPMAQAAQAASPVSRVLLLPLPEDEPIPDAQQFNPSGLQASAAIQSGVLVPGASQDIPANMLAVVRSVTLDISDMLATTSVQWTLRYNQNPIPGFQNLTIFPRVSPFVGVTFPALVRLNGAGTLDVVFNNLDGGTYSIGASFSGWFWPIASDARWKAGGA